MNQRFDDAQLDDAQPNPRGGLLGVRETVAALLRATIALMMLAERQCEIRAGKTVNEYVELSLPFLALPQYKYPQSHQSG